MAIHPLATAVATHVTHLKDSDLTVHTYSGINRDVQEFSKLTFTWRGKNEAPIESFITLSLLPKEDGTRIQLEHSSPGSGSEHNYAKEWRSTFSKFERLLSTLI